MRQWVLYAPGKLALREEEKNPVPEKGEALVEIHSVALCGSDYSLYQGTYSGPAGYPLTPGHEWAGRVLSCGEKDCILKPGSRVTGDCSFWGKGCKEREKCRYNKNICPEVEKFGITKNGFLTELALVPLRCLYPAPEDMPYELLALSEFFAVALQAVKKSGIREGYREEVCKRYEACKKHETKEKILVLGAGPVGIAVCLLLTLMCRLTDVWLYDTDGERLAFLQRTFPEIKTYRTEPEEEDGGYAGLLRPTGFTLIFEASGAPEAVNHAFRMVNPDGRIVLTGMYPAADIRMKDVVLKGITVTGSIGGTGSFAEVILFLYRNRETVQKVITSVYGFEEADKALREKGKNCIKKIIQVKAGEGNEGAW